MKRLAFLLLIASAIPAMAEGFKMWFPVDCVMGTSCFIEDYVDSDPRSGKQNDYTCGIRSRDGHKGTDFALISLDAVERGVEVRAAAAGTVLRTRDGMPDDHLMRNVTSQNACGNAVLIDHGRGWNTLYCHLKMGSVRLEQGMTVAAGTPLGLVGLSGQTNHPHLHLTVMKDGQIVDPFRPEGAGCGETKDTLWVNPIKYEQTGFLTAGFSNHVPSIDDIRAGGVHVTSSGRDKPIVVFGHLGHARPGDVLQLSATGPQGEVFSRKAVLENPKVSQMRAFGRKAPRAGWPKGDYIGRALLTRDGQLVAHRFAFLTVE